MTTLPPTNTVAAELLERLEAVGGAAWIVRGQLRLRPLDAIPEALIAEIRSNDAQVSALVAARPKRKRLGSTPEGRFLVRVRGELLRSIDGMPTKAQKLLAERIAWLSWHVKTFDDKAVASGGLSAHAAREYLAYSNSLERCTRHFMAIKGAPKPVGLPDQWSGFTTDQA